VLLRPPLGLLRFTDALTHRLMACHRRSVRGVAALLAVERPAENHRLPEHRIAHAGEAVVESEEDGRDEDVLVGIALVEIFRDGAVGGGHPPAPRFDIFDRDRFLRDRVEDVHPEAPHQALFVRPQRRRVMALAVCVVCAGFDHVSTTGITMRSFIAAEIAIMFGSRWPT